MRTRNAHFEPLSQEVTAARPDEEELRDAPRAKKSGTKDVDVNIEPVEAGVAGPAHLL
jgi:hypothetical protein